VDYEAAAASPPSRAPPAPRARRARGVAEDAPFASCHLCRQRNQALKVVCSSCASACCVDCLLAAVGVDVGGEAWRDAFVCLRCCGCCTCSLCRHRDRLPLLSALGEAERTLARGAAAAALRAAHAAAAAGAAEEEGSQSEHECGEGWVGAPTEYSE